MLNAYDYTIEYHPGKANMVADALTRKANSSVACLQVFSLSSLIDLRSMNVDLSIDNCRASLATLKIRPVLKERIQQAQL